ncbi:MAG: hypothetical protein ACLP6E_08150 [Acidimicrobiales bacterium]
MIDPPCLHKPKGPVTRAQIEVDSNPELPDYSGPFKADLRFLDFPNLALVNVIANMIAKRDLLPSVRRSVGRRGPQAVEAFDRG